MPTGTGCRATRSIPRSCWRCAKRYLFFDTLRLVMVDGLLGTVESRSGGGRGRQRNSGFDGWQPLVQAIPQMPDTTLLLLSDGPVSANNALLRALNPVCSVEEQTAPRGEQLLRWIKENAEAKSSSISPAAMRSMADLVGGDLWTLDQELEKLSLYAGDREIGEADVRLMVSQVREASIFEAVDAMIAGRPQAALRLLAQLRDDGREPQYIIGMVERQLRLLALARDSMERRVPQNELKRALGTSSDFVVRKTMEQAKTTPAKTLPGATTGSSKLTSPSSRVASTPSSPWSCW